MGGTGVGELLDLGGSGKMGGTGLGGHRPLPRRDFGGFQEQEKDTELVRGTRRSFPVEMGGSGESQDPPKPLQGPPGFGDPPQNLPPPIRIWGHPLILGTPPQNLPPPFRILGLLSRFGDPPQTFEPPSGFGDLPHNSGPLPTSRFGGPRRFWGGFGALPELRDTPQHFQLPTGIWGLPPDFEAPDGDLGDFWGGFWGFLGVPHPRCPCAARSGTPWTPRIWFEPS